MIIKIDIKNEKLFAMFLEGMNKKYKISQKKKHSIFEIEKPYFSQDEVLIKNFSIELAKTI